MKSTVYRVYTASSEVKFTVRHGHQYQPEITRETAENAIIDAADPTLKHEFKTAEEAVNYLRSYYPEMKIDSPSGMSVKYIRISGAYVAEIDLELDDDGDIVDENWCGSVEISRFPETICE